MIANYHSHTSRCHHATGTQREYVEKAIEAGYKIWGFSDHTPYPFDNGYVSGIRMLPEELEGYVRETLDLRDEYKDDIEIHLGLEVEYFPKHFEALLRLTENYPIEYFLLAQHSTNNDYDGVYVGLPTDDEIECHGSLLSAGPNGVFSENISPWNLLILASGSFHDPAGSPALYDR